jgi:hypothetical protein
MQGRLDEATRLYREAWEARQDDYEACIVSHYLARVQRTPNKALAWNQASLRYADTANDERVAPFYPSLYLNMGKAHEDLRAEAKAASLPEGKYGDMVRRGVAEGLRRIAELPQPAE